MRPPPSRRCANTFAPFGGPRRWSSGTRTSRVDDVVVVARLGHDLHARCLSRHHEHAVGAHHEQDVGDPARRGEPLLAVDHPLVAVLDGMGLEQARVAAALRLGHRVRREHVLIQQRLEPALLLLLGAVGGEHLHVAGVGRRGTEHVRSPGIAADDLVEQAELELSEARAAEVLVEEDRPEALILDLLLEFADISLHRGIGRAHRVGEHVVERLDLLFTELLDPVELLLELRFGAEIPRHARSLSSSVARRAQIRFWGPRDGSKKSLEKLSQKVCDSPWARGPTH